MPESELFPLHQDSSGRELEPPQRGLQPNLAAGTEDVPPTGLDEGRDHGRIGYGRYARYTPAALAVILVAVLLAIGLNQRQPTSGPASPSRLLGKPAPDVALTRLDGRPLRLTDLRGSVVVVNFWASWCDPCTREMPVFQAVTDEAARNGEQVAVVGVGTKQDNDENARAFVTDHRLTYPIGRDTAGSDVTRGPIQDAFGVSDFPTTFFIRPDGTVAAVHLGEMDAQQIRADIQTAK